VVERMTGLLVDAEGMPSYCRPRESTGRPEESCHRWGLACASDGLESWESMAGFVAGLRRISRWKLRWSMSYSTCPSYIYMYRRVYTLTAPARR